MLAFLKDLIGLASNGEPSVIGKPAVSTAKKGTRAPFIKKLLAAPTKAMTRTQNINKPAVSALERYEAQVLAPVSDNPLKPSAETIAHATATNKPAPSPKRNKEARVLIFSKPTASNLRMVKKPVVSGADKPVTTKTATPTPVANKPAHPPVRRQEANVANFIKPTASSLRRVTKFVTSSTNKPAALLKKKSTLHPSFSKPIASLMKKVKEVNRFVFKGPAASTVAKSCQAQVADKVAAIISPSRPEATANVEKVSQSQPSVSVTQKSHPVGNQSTTQSYSAVAQPIAAPVVSTSPDVSL